MNDIVKLYDLIKRNNPADWSNIVGLLNSVELDEVCENIIAETLARSCHFRNFYRAKVA